jgi:glycosyltransferase involved in cell wall biosynthesis
VAKTSAVVISILIPAYNESATVGSVLRRILSLPLSLEVIVIDDGSRDGTASRVEECAGSDSRVRLIRQERNQGKTSAIRAGLKLATGEVVVIQDADEEYDPAEIPALVAPILEGRADVVYGSRFLVRRAARVLYFYHFLANRALTLLSNLLTNRNMSDIETGFKAFRTGVIRPLRLCSRGFGMEVEITAMVCKTNARTYEVPISYYGRTYEEGKKIKFTDGVWALVYILYFNLIYCRLASGRAYVAMVNEFLRTDQDSSVPCQSSS